MQKNKLIKKYSARNIFYKALYNSIAGLPVAMLLTAAMVPFIYWATSTLYWGVAAILISTPFFIVSVLRQFLIDYTYEKYNININPTYIFGRLYHIIKISLNRPEKAL